MNKKLNLKLTSTQVIALGFFVLILIGAFLLCLPISSRSGEWTSPLVTLFTATSATCVTGLVLYDTYTHWSIVGQLIILVLIQVGGIGFMTIITMLSVIIKRRIGLHERQLLVQSAGTLHLSGIVRLIKQIVVVSLCIEFIGAVLLSTRFCPQMGFWQGLYNAVFHSISAFCNAGFDLMGKYEQFSSLTNYVNDPIVNLTISLLIIIGGIGFIVWDDIIKHKWNFREYELHSKIVLTTTTLLICTGWLLFYFFEYDGLLSELDGKSKVIAALFQSVTTRTAGFNTIDMGKLSESSSFLTIILMFIGGSSGSTAGGIKTTTLSVLLLSAIASSSRVRHVTAFKRRIDDNIVKEAGAFFTIYISAVTISTMLLCSIESFSLKQILFEVVSAIGTVGLSMGITSSLGTISKVVIMILMFIGRVGWLTLVFALAGKHFDPPVKRAPVKILIG